MTNSDIAVVKPVTGLVSGAGVSYIFCLSQKRLVELLAVIKVLP